MKRTRLKLTQLISMVLTLAMVIALAMPAFAAEEPTPMEELTNVLREDYKIKDKDANDIAFLICSSLSPVNTASEDSDDSGVPVNREGIKEKLAELSGVLHRILGGKTEKPAARLISVIEKITEKVDVERVEKFVNALTVLTKQSTRQVIFYKGTYAENSDTVQLTLKRSQKQNISYETYSYELSVMEVIALLAHHVRSHWTVFADATRTLGTRINVGLIGTVTYLPATLATIAKYGGAIALAETVAIATIVVIGVIVVGTVVYRIYQDSQTGSISVEYTEQTETAVVTN